MSDPVTNEEVEDVLSSIRRLVSEDKRPIARKIEDPGGERLVLTPAHRIAGIVHADHVDAEDSDQEDVAATEPQLADDHTDSETVGTQDDVVQQDVEALETAQGDSVTEDGNAETDVSEDSVNSDEDAKADEALKSESLDADDDFEERLHREIQGARNETVKDAGHEDDVACTDDVTIELDDDNSDNEASESTCDENIPDEQMSEAANDNSGTDNTGADKNEDISDYLWSDRRREDFLPAKHVGFHGPSPQPTEINETVSQSEELDAPDDASDASTDTFTLSQAEADAVLSASTEENLTIRTIEDVVDVPDIDDSSADEATLEDVTETEDDAAEQDDTDVSETDETPEDIEATEDSPIVAALGSKIEALESAVGRISTDWDPDDAGTDDYSGTKAPAMEWKDNVNLDAKGTPVIDGTTEIASPEDIEDAEEIEDADEEQSREDALAEAAELSASADVSDAPDTLETGAAPLSAFVSRRAASDSETEPSSADEQYVDEEMLRELVGDIVRSELQGVLGERITRNVRKLVRREIQRVLAAQNLDK